MNRERPFRVGEIVRLKSSAPATHPMVKENRELLDHVWLVEDIDYDDGTHFLRQSPSGEEGICVRASEIERLPGK